MSSFNETWARFGKHNPWWRHEKMGGYFCTTEINWVEKKKKINKRKFSRLPFLVRLKYHFILTVIRTSNVTRTSPATMPMTTVSAGCIALSNSESVIKKVTRIEKNKVLEFRHGLYILQSHFPGAINTQSNLAPHHCQIKGNLLDSLTPASLQIGWLFFR